MFRSIARSYSSADVKSLVKTAKPRQAKVRKAPGEAKASSKAKVERGLVKLQVLGRYQSALSEVGREGISKKYSKNVSKFSMRMKLLEQKQNSSFQG